MARFFGQSGLRKHFERSPAPMAAALITLTIIGAAALAPVLAPYDPFDLAAMSLREAESPPAWIAGGSWRFFLGTDAQGRDVLSAILYGARLSIIVGAGSVALALLLGVGLGLLAGWFGGIVDILVMRLADVQLSFPAILVALLIDGIARGTLPRDVQPRIATYVIIAAIALSSWVHYARTIRGSILVERRKEYIQAARLLGVSSARIMLTHLLPNAIGPILVLATINLAVAILTEATLSFLGVGLPPTQPSLGTLIRTGNDYLLSGSWWISIFPGLVLSALIYSVNLLGDWLRDRLDPTLR